MNIIESLIPKENIFKDEPMINHTSFRTGGVAKYFVTPSSFDEIASLTKALRNEDKNFAVIGNGSNLLVSDKGFDGTVVSVGKNLSDITVSGEKITAMAGALLSRISSVALKNSLSGFGDHPRSGRDFYICY